MVSGAFKSMTHDHEFIATPEGTSMRDRFDFESPFGVLGHLVNRIYLYSYLRRFLVCRNETLKRIAEGEDWKHYLPAA